MSAAARDHLGLVDTDEGRLDLEGGQVTAPVEVLVLGPPAAFGRVLGQLLHVRPRLVVEVVQPCQGVELVAADALQFCGLELAECRPRHTRLLRDHFQCFPGFLTKVAKDASQAAATDRGAERGFHGNNLATFNQRFSLNVIFGEHHVASAKFDAMCDAFARCRPLPDRAVVLGRSVVARVCCFSVGMHVMFRAGRNTSPRSPPWNGGVVRSPRTSPRGSHPPLARPSPDGGHRGRRPPK